MKIFKLTEMIYEYITNVTIMEVLCVVGISILLSYIISKMFNNNKNNIYDFICLFFIFLFVSVIIHITLTNRVVQVETYMQLELFKTFHGVSFAKGLTLVSLNFLLFLPFGILLSIFIYKKTSFFVSFIIYLSTSALLSTSIEIIQYITKKGVFQIDDIIFNVLGGLFGCVLFCLYNKLIHYLKE